MSFPRFEQITRGYQGFFARWGAKANLRGIWNQVLPVAIVDRFRGPEEGSLRGLTAYCWGTAGEFSSVIFGSLGVPEGYAPTELEVIGLRCAVRAGAADPGPVSSADCHVFTPIGTYNPVSTLNPVGYWAAGLLLDPAFTYGAAVAFGGTAPTLPLAGGFHIGNGERGFGLGTDWYELATYRDGWLPRPLRLFAGTAIVVQHTYARAGVPMHLRASFLYRERTILA